MDQITTTTDTPTTTTDTPITETTTDTTTTTTTDTTTNQYNEYKDKLIFFTNLKIKEKEYNKIKNNVLSNYDKVKSEDLLLGDLYTERNSLLCEFKKYETILKDIQSDLQKVESIIIESKSQRDSIKRQIDNQQKDELNPLKDKIDQLRNQLQLQSLPSIESERDQLQSQYLKGRLNEELMNQRIKQQQLILNQISNNNSNNGSNSNGIDVPHVPGKRGRKRKSLVD